MTKQEQNDLILTHIDSELRDTPGVQERVGKAFSKWFQGLIQSAQPEEPVVPAEGEAPVEEETEANMA
jgi:hypothetical protein